MAKQIKTNQLPPQTDLIGAWVIGLDKDGKDVKMPLASLLRNEKGIALPATVPSGIRFAGETWQVDTTSYGSTFTGFGGLTVPLKVGTQYVANARFVYNNGAWTLQRELVDAPSNSDDLITKAQLGYKLLDLAPYLKYDLALSSAGVEQAGVGYVTASKVPVNSSTKYAIDNIFVIINAKYMAEFNTSNLLVAGSIKALSSSKFTFDSSATTKFVSFTFKAPAESSSVTIIREEAASIVSLNGSPLSDPTVRGLTTFKTNVFAYRTPSIALTSAGEEVTGVGYTSAIRIPVNISSTNEFEVGGIVPVTNAKQIVEYNSIGTAIKTTTLSSIPYRFKKQPTTTRISFTIKAPSEVNDDSVTNAYFIEYTTTLPIYSLSKIAYKKGVSFGDSITWYDGKLFNSSHNEMGQRVIGYQTHLRDKLGCNITNKGESGWDMVQIQTIIKAYDFSTTDFATITSGANDHRKNILPGMVGAIGGAFNLSTYAGAMQSCIEYILNQNKNCKIYLITPINGWYNQAGTTDVPGPYKGEMNISRDYVDVIIGLGMLYSIPVCNWYDNVSINKINRPAYIGDKEGIPYYLHPNQEGFKMMGEYLANFISNN